MASSCPWSPITSSASTGASTNPTHPQRPPSRARTTGVIGASSHSRPRTIPREGEEIRAQYAYSNSFVFTIQALTTFSFSVSAPL
jgi:hypothetical protein